MPLFHKIAVSLDRKAGALAAVFVIISLMGTQLARAEDVFANQDVFKDLQERWSFDSISLTMSKYSPVESSTYVERSKVSCVI